MSDLHHPADEHLRASPAEERLRSFGSDHKEAWGVVLALLALPLIYSWSMFPVMAAIAGVLAAVLVGSAVFSWARKKFLNCQREGQR